MNALTRQSKETVIQRVQGNPTLAQALLDQAATLFLNGEPETARLILYRFTNAAEAPGRCVHVSWQQISPNAGGFLWGASYSVRTVGRATADPTSVTTAE